MAKDCKHKFKTIPVNESPKHEEDESDPEYLSNSLDELDVVLERQHIKAERGLAI